MGRRSEKGPVATPDLPGRGRPAPPPAGRSRRAAPPRPLRHQRRGRRDALPPARRPPLQRHDPRARGIRRARPLALGEKARHAAFVVAISHFTRSQLYRWCATADWARIHVVRCGLDEVFLTTAGVPVPDRPRLVNVGRLAEQKGQLLLVEAAARLRDRGLDFELVIVGDGPLRDELERAHRPARPAGPRADHRLPGQPGGPPRAGGRAGPGAAQLRRRAAGGDHGGDGPGPAGDRHVHRGHPGAGRAGPERLAGPGRGRRAAGRRHGRGPGGRPGRAGPDGPRRRRPRRRGSTTRPSRPASSPP